MGTLITVLRVVRKNDCALSNYAYNRSPYRVENCSLASNKPVE